MRMMTSQNHVLDWLLEDDQPAVRYHALVDLMDFPPADPAVEEARAAIPLRGWAAEILRTQKPGGHCFDSEKGTLDCWEALAAFGALGRERLTRSMKRSVERGSEFYLERKLHKEGSRKYAPWFRFHYPTHYYYDILVGLDVLTALGYGDDRRLEYGLKVLREKRQPDGRWHLDAVHPDLGPGAKYRVTPPVTPFALEEAGRASKWITLTALRVLKRVEGEVAAE